MMIHGNSPASNIPHALVHSNVIRNWSPIKANNGWSPREKAAGMKLPVNKYLLKGPLFCLVFAQLCTNKNVANTTLGECHVFI